MANDNTTLPEPITRQEMYLYAIAQNGGGGGGSDLPAVTSEDNGDVLTVVDGVWDKAAPSGGGGTFVVTYTAIPDSPDGEMTCDKTIAEIHAAIQSGANVVARRKSQDSASYEALSLAMVVYQDNAGQLVDYISFTAVNANWVGDDIIVSVLTINHFTDGAYEVGGDVTATPQS